MKKLLLILSMILGLNTSALMAELTQTQFNVTLGIVTNFILDDNTVYHHAVEYKIVTSPYTGKQWLDRNLGASQACTSFDDPLCYGDYYQWGRNFDGHQESNSSTTTTLATDINSAGSSFIINGSNPYDWTSADNDGSLRSVNWSKIDGSSVCPVGFRVPTSSELQAETIDHDVTNRDTAFSNFLKLPSAGFRSNHNAAIVDIGSLNGVWSSSISGSNLYYLYSNSVDAALVSNGQRSGGLSVRCLRD